MPLLAPYIIFSGGGGGQPSTFSGLEQNNAPSSSTVTLGPYTYYAGTNVVVLHSGTQTVNTVTLDGSSCAQRVTMTFDGQYLQMWDVSMGSGGSGNVVITHGGTPFRTGAGLFFVESRTFVAASSVTDSDNSEIIDLTATLTAGDDYLAIGYLRDSTYSGGATFTGFTEAWDAVNDASRFTFGGYIFDAVGGSTTAQIDTNESPPEFSAGGVAAIWR